MHPPLAQMRGQEVDIAIQAEQIIHLKRILVRLIGFHTGQPIQQTETDSDRDRCFNAAEANNYGFIDAVVSAPPTSASPLPERRSSQRARRRG